MDIVRVRDQKGLHTNTRNGKPVYSHAVLTTRPKLVFITGQLAKDERGEVVGKGDMRAQIRQVGANLKAALAAAGATLADVVKTTTYVTDVDEFFRHSDVRGEIFGDPPPTSTTIVVKALAHPDFMVEIEAIAVKEK